MTKMVQEAIEALQGLPQERQTTVARAIIDYAAYEGSDVYQLNEAEREAVQEGVEQADRGEFVPHAEVQRFRRRHGA